MAHRKKILDKTKGQKDPTQAAAPSAQKYRYPIEKGLAKLDPKTGADGEPLALTEYGRRFSGPTSVAVADSDAMADFDIAQTGGDAALTAEKYAAMNGVLLQMFNHGLTAATMFWFVAMLEKRTGGLRGLNDFGGLRKVAPVFTGLMGIALFSSLGLPGLNGFIGEFLIFKGSFPLVPWATSLAVIGLLITAIFVLGILQKVFFGPLNEKWASFPDLTTGERLALAPAIGLMFALGLYPQLVLGVINNSVIQMVQHLRF